jgi:hypothetical protein
VSTVNPGGTLSPTRDISARFAPFPPRRAFASRAPSARPPPNRNTRPSPPLAAFAIARSLASVASFPFASVTDARATRRARAPFARARVVDVGAVVFAPVGLLAVAVGIDRAPGAIVGARDGRRSREFRSGASERSVARAARVRVAASRADARATTTHRSFGTLPREGPRGLDRSRRARK